MQLFKKIFTVPIILEMSHLLKVWHQGLTKSFELEGKGIMGTPQLSSSIFDITLRYSLRSRICSHNIFNPPDTCPILILALCK